MNKRERSQFKNFYISLLVLIAVISTITISYLSYLLLAYPGSLEELDSEITVTIDEGLPITGSNLHYRAFVTSLRYSGKLGGVTGADELCQSAADNSFINPQLKGKYEAWVSTDIVDARDKIEDVEYYLVDGNSDDDDDVKVLNNKADLDDGVLQHKINKNEYGYVVTIDVQTGTDNMGYGSTDTSDNCNNWKSDSNYGRLLGLSYSIDKWSMNSDNPNDDCSEQFRIYCFEVDHDEDNYDADDDCDDDNPDSYPGASEICDGEDNNCDGNLPNNESDDDNDGYMICEGDCNDNNSSIYPGATERCNGKDDNCDGKLPAVEKDRDNDGYMVCEGDCNDADKSVNPGKAEVCDGKDNDCDGKTDENLSRPCGTSIGICTFGEETCSNGNWSSCSGVAPQTETCDGLDNDCDSETDEGCYCDTGDTQVCGTDVGLCQRGTQSCSGGVWGPCTGSIAPSSEICDGKDNDCDGDVDEDLERSCGTDVGLCKSGTSVCESGKWTKCEGKVEPADEKCDDKDNDCDGTIDEGCSCTEDEKRYCGISTGECIKGIQICVNGKWSECEGSLDPRDEICDEIDNDCDGEIDEDQVCIQEDVAEKEEGNFGIRFYKKLGSLFAGFLSETRNGTKLTLFTAFLISLVPIIWAGAKYIGTRKTKKKLDYRKQSQFVEKKKRKKRKSPIQT